MTHLDYYNNNPRYISVLKGLKNTNNIKIHKHSNQTTKKERPNIFTKDKLDLTYSKKLDLTIKSEMHMRTTIILS